MNSLVLDLPPYNYLIEYHGVIGASKQRDTIGFAIGHMFAGRVIIDHVRYTSPENGTMNWDRLKNEIRVLCELYRVEDLLHDSYESESIRLHLHGFLFTETPLTGTYRAQIYSSFETLMYQKLIEYPSDARLLSEIKNLQRDTEWPVGPGMIANLAYTLYTQYVNTREGIDDSRSSQGWPEVDPWEKRNEALIAGGELHPL